MNDVISPEISEKVYRLVGSLSSNLHPLLILAGGHHVGKTIMAQTLEGRGQGTVVNFSAFLARFLLQNDQRAISADRVSGYITSLEQRVVPPYIFDNIELIFLKNLHIAAIPFFQALARHAPIVVVWPTAVANGIFNFSQPNRPDYYSFYNPDVLVINL